MPRRFTEQRIQMILAFVNMFLHPPTNTQVVPTLNKRQPEPEGDQSKWFIRTPGPNHPFTFQLKPEGYKWLLGSGLGHKRDIDWDVFEILRSLELIYTLDSSYTPSDAPIPDNFSFEEIPVKERINLGEKLLNKFRTSELSTQEATLNFFLSFGDLDWEFQQSIMEIILTGTPFDAHVISDYDVAFEEHGHGDYGLSLNYNPILLALVLSVVYDAIEPIDNVETINEGNPIWVYSDWIVCAGTELIFHTVNGVVTEALPDLLRRELGATAESIAHEGHFYSFLQHELSALSEFQFIMSVQDQNPWLGSIIAQGLKTGYRDSILILPRADTGADGPYEASNEPIL